MGPIGNFANVKIRISRCEDRTIGALDTELDPIGLSGFIKCDCALRAEFRNGFDDALGLTIEIVFFCDAARNILFS